MIILLAVSNMNLCSVYFAKEGEKYRFFFFLMLHFLTLPFSCSFSTTLSIMAVKHTVMLLVAVCLYLPGLNHGFQPSFSVDETHRDITRKAVLRKTAEVCRDLATVDGRDFNLKVGLLSFKMGSLFMHSRLV